MAEPKKIAAIVSTYFSHSHADLIVSKFATGFPTDQGDLKPKVDSLVKTRFEEVPAI